jgi:hypothetical protein
MAETAVETPTQTKQKPPQRTKPKPPARTAKRTETPSHSITESMSRIQVEDWGTRAYVYVYRLEPMIDRTRTGDAKYIQVYNEPVTEDRLMVDHGSGRYKLMLNFKKPGAERGDEMDSGFMEILNVKFPPKIPEGHWVDDPKNTKWAWAKQYFTKEPTQQNGGDPVEMLRVLNEVQDSAIARNGSSKETVSPLEYLRMGKEMATPVKATEDSTLKAVMDLTQMMLNKSMEESRELRAEMRAMRERPVTPPVDPLVMLTTTIEKLTPVVERLFPNIKKAGEEVVEKAVRSRLGSWQEFFQPVLPGVVDLLKPVIATVSQGILMSQHTNPGTPLPNGARPGAQPQPTGGAATGGTIADLLNFVTPVMIDYVRDEADGAAFADWINSGWGIEKLDQVRIASVDQMIAFLQTKHWWNNKGKSGTEPSLAELQPQLRVFLEEFMAWQPDEKEEDEGEDGADKPVIDLMAEPMESMI